MNKFTCDRREWLYIAGGTAVCAAVDLPSTRTTTAAASEKPNGLKNLLLLAIDDQSLPFHKNVGLYLNQPKVRPEAVLKPSAFGSGAPDDSAAHFYGTVLLDGGKYRMWYYACHWGMNPDWSPAMMRQVSKPNLLPLFQGPLCYAESDDGITWTKPNLGQVLFKGSRNNNAIALPHTVVSGAIVVKDDEAIPAERYKMTYQFFPNFSQPDIPEYGRMPSVALAVSPDGLTWKMIGIPFRDQFVEPSSFVKHAGQYVIHYQAAGNLGGYYAEGGTPSGRTGVARVSSNFSQWPDLLVETFALAEPEDRSKRGLSGDYDQVHLGVGAASFGNVCVGLYGLWHNAEFEKSFSQISCDFGLLVSNDGIRFREPVKGHRFLRRDESLVTPVPGHNFNTILCQANGILNVGDETRIYHGRWRNADGRSEQDSLKYYSGEVALATLPRDRWGSLGLNPETTEGTITSAVISLPGSVEQVNLNADAARAIRIEIVDEQFQPITDFAGANAGVVETDGGLDCPIRWPNGTIAKLAGRKIRLQLQLKQQEKLSPRLYAINIRSR